MKAHPPVNAMPPMFSRLTSDVDNHKSGAAIGDVTQILGAAGYTLDTSNSSFWVASGSNNNIMNSSKAGNFLQTSYFRKR